MNKTRECEEIVKNPDSGKLYRFAGTFDFITKLAINGRDPSFIFNDLAEGLLPPEEINLDSPWSTTSTYYDSFDSPPTFP